jgi:hypothetical protein
VAAEGTGREYGSVFRRVMRLPLTAAKIMVLLLLLLANGVSYTCTVVIACAHWIVLVLAAGYVCLDSILGEVDQPWREYTLLCFLLCVDELLHLGTNTGAWFFAAVDALSLIAFKFFIFRGTTAVLISSPSYLFSSLKAIDVYGWAAIWPVLKVWRWLLFTSLVEWPLKAAAVPMAVALVLATVKWLRYWDVWCALLGMLWWTGRMESSLGKLTGDSW